MHSLSSHRTRVLLVYPRFRLPTGDPPLGLAYIASSLIATGRVDVRIYDATFQHPSVTGIITAMKQFDPDIVGIYVDTFMYADAISVANVAKQFGKFVVFGGPHATVMPETLISKSDIVVIGEGEQPMVEIMEHFADRTFNDIAGIWHKVGEEIVKTAPRNNFCDLDTIRFPAFDHIDMKSYMARWHYLDCLNIGYKGTNLIGSRGCPFNCSYCQPTLRMTFGNRTRYRSPENVVQELQFLKQRYNLKAFFFHDDTLTADKPRLLALCEQIRKSDLNMLWACNARADTIDSEMMGVMYAAGLRKLHIGAESGSERILDSIYHKQITTEQVRNTVAMAKSAGVKTLCFFILGAPTETWDELRQTIRFACSLPIDEATFSILTPLPGSTIRHDIIHDSRYSVSADFSTYNYYSARVFNDPQLSGRALKLGQMMALIRFYSHYKRWTYLASHLKSRGGVMKLLRKISRSI